MTLNRLWSSDASSSSSQDFKTTRRSSLLQMWRKRSGSSEEVKRPECSSSQSPISHSGLPAVTEVQDHVSDMFVRADYLDLHRSIIIHVQRYYSASTTEDKPSQYETEHATIGLDIPWHRILVLMENERARREILFLCIGKAILGRCLLLKSGTSFGTYNSFLPSELIESFQSFCFDKVLEEEGNDNDIEGLSVLNLRSSLLTKVLIIDANRLEIVVAMETDLSRTDGSQIRYKSVCTHRYAYIGH